MPKTPFTLSLLTLVIMAGCIPPVRSNITAYVQHGAAARKRFVLQGPDPRSPGGDPRWPVFSQMLTKALVAKGFIEDSAMPELIIRVSYRMGDTQTYTSTSINPAPTGVDGTPVGFPTESTTTSESTMRVIQLEALDPASVQAGKPDVLWRTHATSRGAGDLDEVFPAMVAAMEDYFAKSASARVEVVKHRSDPEAQRLALP